jgi:phage shock protein A
MNTAEAKEYLFHHISALKLTEQACRALDAEIARWKARVDLARSKAAEDLALEAEQELARLQSKREGLAGEAAELRDQIEKMRRNLAGASARERSVDPDLLEQEFRILLGEDLTAEDSPEARTRESFNAIQADAALEALKAKMKGAKP